MRIFSWGRDREAAAPPVEVEVKLLEPARQSPIITPPPPPRLEVTTTIGDGPYASNAEHIHDELARIDQLVRAQVIRWRNAITPDKPPEDWGMARLSEREIDAYLRTPFKLPGGWGVEQPAPVIDDSVDTFVSAAARFADKIKGRVDRTSPDVNLRLPQLQELFKLEPLDRDILLICLLPEVDGRYRWIYGYLQEDILRTRASVELVLQILAPVIDAPEVGRAALEKGSRLLSSQLVRTVRDGEENEPLPLRSVRVDDRIADYLLGRDGVDERLDGLIQEAESVLWAGLVLDDTESDLLRRIVAWQRETPTPAVLFLHGPDAGLGIAVASAVCTDLPRTLLCVDAGAAMDARPDWRETVRLCCREAALRGAAILWIGCDRLLERGQPTAPWDCLIEERGKCGLLTFLQSQTHWEPGESFRGTEFVRVQLPLPHYELRRRIWTERMPPDSEFKAPPPDRERLAESLAASFQITESQVVASIASARSLARQRSPQSPELTVPDLYEACRRQAGRRLMTFAKRIEPRTKLSFDDLILPKPNTRQLQELRSRIKVRDRVYTGLGFEQRIALGKGVIALFTGASGTGKTMAAELLARDQGVDIYKVDLASIVSKWIGETEKNLGVLFSEAEDANAIIFFDEADALFGKRGEVKEAKDRWANSEIDYLLQRVEEYSGVVILATNLRQNIDEAFLRRIHAVVDFPAPDADARKKIWEGMFPAGLGRPTEQELEDVAKRFRVAGGSIKNIVVDAAYRALAQSAHDPPNITLRQLIASTAREFEKLGKPLTRSEFGDEYFRWIEEDIMCTVEPAEN